MATTGRFGEPFRPLERSGSPRGPRVRVGTRREGSENRRNGGPVRREPRPWRFAMSPVITYAIRSCCLGRLLAATTARGVCHVRFADADSDLVEGLRQEFPYAELVRDDVRAGWAVRRIAGSIESGAPLELPLDVRGSRFQRRVWDALRAIPRGTTRTYGDLAAQLGQPGAARAVARACGANPVPVAIPCHRVVPRAGGAGGYRYGAWRKQALLESEGASPAGSASARGSCRASRRSRARRASASRALRASPRSSGIRGTPR